MDVSVIVPTYNGAHKILNILIALENQTFKDFETVIVVDGSTDNTVGLLNGFKSSLKKLKVIEQVNKGRAAVRNTGARLAVGNLLVFFDDDVRPLPNCIEEHVDFHHKSSHEAILVGSPLEEESKMLTDVQKYKAFLSRKWLEPYRNLKSPLSENNLFITAANFSIPKALFWNLNGFDERLTDAEDYDLGNRAIKFKVPIYFNFNAIVWHDDFITAKSYVKRQRQYKTANKLLSSIGSNSYNRYVAANLKSGIKPILYQLLPSNFLVGLIDKNAFIFLPKKIRYKLYDIIIHAASN